MSLLQKAFSSRFKRQILDLKITKLLPFVCLQTAFEYQECTYFFFHLRYLKQMFDIRFLNFPILELYNTHLHILNWILKWLANLSMQTYTTQSPFTRSFWICQYDHENQYLSSYAHRVFTDFLVVSKALCTKAVTTPSM